MSFNVDGVAFNDPGNGGGAYSFRHGMSTLPSVDAVSEFKIDSNSQKAEFEGAASVTIATKSGTNTYHGSLFYFNRNKATTARNFFASSNPPFNRNEFGAMIGGPIVKNRTFFFGGYESLLERSPRTFTLQRRHGGYARRNFAGLNTLIDPLSGTPFANNVIPTSRIDSRAKTLMDRVALPNTAGQGAGTSTTTSPISRTIRTLTAISCGWITSSRIATACRSPATSRKRIRTSWRRPIRKATVNWRTAGMTRASATSPGRGTSPRRSNELRVGYTYHGPVRQGMNRDFDPRTIFPDSLWTAPARRTAECQHQRPRVHRRLRRQ